MRLNHEAIRRVYPNCVTIDDGTGAFDAQGNPINLDQAAVSRAALEIKAEHFVEAARSGRASAYRNESDPLFFKWQRGEATQAEWVAKVEEIRARYPYAD